MSHSFHPDLGDPARPAILVDGCPRCEEHARNLTSLDAAFIGALWRKMDAVERKDADTYASATEKRACVQLWRFALILARYTDVDPWSLFAAVPA
jgi:hypothetical protein